MKEAPSAPISFIMQDHQAFTCRHIKVCFILSYMAKWCLCSWNVNAKMQDKHLGCYRPHMSVTKHAGPSCQPEKRGGKGAPYLGRLLAGPRCGEGAEARAVGLRGGKGSWASGCWANRPRGKGLGCGEREGFCLFFCSFSSSFCFFFKAISKQVWKSFLKQFDLPWTLIKSTQFNKTNAPKMNAQSYC